MDDGRREVGIGIEEENRTEDRSEDGTEEEEDRKGEMGGGKEGREGMGWEIGREWLRGRGREGGRGEE